MLRTTLITPNNQQSHINDQVIIVDIVGYITYPYEQREDN